ncbi:ankyrin repeat domain-containing protein [Gracilinema caldarium]|uniref:ankyrin repeat domain-containing protein n=1 Tax=Gracilinema caldarium TaxID=215591 RepID=UPI00350E5329
MVYSTFFARTNRLGLCIAASLILAGLNLLGCTSAPPPEPVKEDDVWTLIDKGQSDKVRDYFRGKMDVNTTDSKGRTPLQRAVEANDAELTAFFIALGANVDTQDPIGRTALEIACQNEAYACIETLAKANANIFISSKSETAPLTVAIQKGEAMLQALLNEKTALQKNEQGQNALHIASSMGNITAVRRILDFSIPPNIRDSHGNTALDLAFQYADSFKHAQVAEKLIQSGYINSNEVFSYFSIAVRSSNPNIRFADGLSPLHYASRYGHSGIVQLLLERKADVNIKDGSGTTALHEAARSGFINIMQMLLDSGATINAQDAKGNTALHIVMPSMVRKDGISLLLNRGANTNLKDNHGDAPLHICIALDMGKDIASLLISQGADVNIRNAKGKTPLHIAVEMDRKDYISILLNKQADIFADDINGKTPFDVALALKNSSLTELITQDTVQKSDNKGNTLLHIATLSAAPARIIAHIIDQKNLVQSRNKAGDTALHFAVEQDEREIGELLITRGADIFAVNAKGESPLYIALKNPDKIRQWMLNSSTYDARDGLGNGILHYTAQWQMDSIIPILVQRGVSLEMKNATGETPLFFAVKNNAPQTIRSLLAAGSNIQSRDKLGNTALHAAVRWNAIACVPVLIQAGLDPNIQNLSGDTALHQAVRLGMGAIVTSLIQAKANLDLRNNQGNTPLFEAITSGVPASVELLLEAGSDPMARNLNGDTPLHIAVASNQKEICNLLLTRGSAIHAQNAAGKTPFQLAMAGSSDIVNTLLTKDRLSLSDDYGRSPLHIAILAGAPVGIIKTIMELGARLNIIDSQGKTPLRLAVEVEAWDTARYLIDSGSDIFIKASDGESPADLAITKGPTVIKVLLNSKNINNRDSMGNTLLHYAASKGNSEVITTLLELGAIKNIKNNDDETPYDTAKRWGRTNAMNLLK